MPIRRSPQTGEFSTSTFGEITTSTHTTLYYAVFEGSVVAVGISYLAPAIDLRLALLVVAIYSIVFVLGPIQNWLDRLNGALLPIYGAGILTLLVMAYNRGGFSFAAWASDDVTVFGVVSVFCAYMGLWILPMCTFDFARYGRKADAGYHGAINFGLPYYVVTIGLNGIAGIALVLALGQKSGVTEISVIQDIIRLMGIWGLIFLWATQTRINTANYYLAAINFSGLFRFVTGRSLPHLAAVVIVGMLAYALMLGNVVSYLLTALAYQGIFVVAWVAVAFTHTFWRNSSGTVEVSAPTIRIGGLASWLLGVAGGVVMHLAGGAGSFAAPLISVFISGLSYSIYGAWMSSRSAERSMA